MQKFIDDIPLDINNEEFNKADDFVRNTDAIVYLTGKAGTGKTTFLKHIKATTEKNTVILAPTGVAAINAGGVTINSFFQIPFGPFIPDDPRLRSRVIGIENNESIYKTFKYSDEKKAIIKALDLLIIDEISMVRADMLDVIDRLLRVFRKKPNTPFGGVQVILIGDTFQLPPIADTEQWEILKRFYETPFFFSSQVIQANTPIYIELKKIYRQNEKEFIDLLNRVRVSQLDSTDLDTLNAKYDPTFNTEDKDYIILATHNKIVNDTNLTKLNQLDTELKVFDANVSGKFPDRHQPTDRELKLKVGAQIMFVKNDSGEYKRYFNGKIGQIKSLDNNIVIIEFDDESTVEVERATWENVEYSYNKEKKRIEEEVIGTFEQYPLRLAWAITVHKSQGLTFEKVIADLGRAFAPGQVYVALSRCTSFGGLKLKTKLTHNAIKTAPQVVEFAKNETPATLVTEKLNTGKADFYYKNATQEFDKGKLKNALGYLKRAFKFRNDFGSVEFDRYLLVKGTRLMGFKTKFEKLQVVHNELSENNSELSEKFDRIHSEFDSYRKRINQEKISFLASTNKLQTKNNTISKELEETRALNLKLEVDIRQKEKEISQEKAKLESSYGEVDRLRKLTWFQKLIGKE